MKLNTSLLITALALSTFSAFAVAAAGTGCAWSRLDAIDEAWQAASEMIHKTVNFPFSNNRYFSQVFKHTINRDGIEVIMRNISVLIDRGASGKVPKSRIRCMRDGQCGRFEGASVVGIYRAAFKNEGDEHRYQFCGNGFFNLPRSSDKCHEPYQGTPMFESQASDIIAMVARAAGLKSQGARTEIEILNMDGEDALTDISAYVAYFNLVGNAACDEIKETPDELDCLGWDGREGRPLSWSCPTDNGGWS